MATETIGHRAAELEQMKKVELSIAQTLRPYRENTEAALVIFALVRCARLLLQRYPEATRTDLRRVVEDFLNERSAPRDDPAANLLIM